MAEINRIFSYTSGHELRDPDPGRKFPDPPTRSGTTGSGSATLVKEKDGGKVQQDVEKGERMGKKIGQATKKDACRVQGYVCSDVNDENEEKKKNYLDHKISSS